jgi:diguanylate cyclase
VEYAEWTLQDLTVTYSYGLIVVSILLAILAAYAAFGIADRMRRVSGRLDQLKWLVGGASAMGVGIWSMHYMGMLAARLPVPVFYYVPTVIWSLVLAMAASAVALLVASTESPNGKHFLCGGLLMGGGIAGMHYMGMAAMRTSAMHHYSPGIVALSITLAVGLSTAALWMISLVQENEAGGGQYRLMASVLMGLGIASMHYVSMAGVRFHADSMPFSLHNTIKVSLLGEAGVAVTALLVLLKALVSAATDKRMYRKLQVAHDQLAASQEALLHSQKELREVNALLNELSIRDGLTGLYNRRHFDSYLNIEWRRVPRLKKPIALLLLDVDHFKQVNDHYGHQYGDDCLRDIARVLETQPRRSGDLAARFGGEEFAILLPGCDLEGGMEVAERIRLAVMETGVEHQSNPEKRMTVSIGVTCYLAATEDSPAKMIGRADQAMYKAKGAGRNCVVGIGGTAVSSQGLAIVKDASKAG